MVELNEFDPSLLRSGAVRFRLSNILTVLGLAHSTTTTSERVEHQGLDPWVQWASVHSGVPAEVHGAMRLGTTRTQGPQIWNALGCHGISWGAWGPINAPMGDPAMCAFFMPDPWSWDEHAYPKQLEDFLELPRYAAKNYLDFSLRAAALPTLRLMRFLSTPIMWQITARFTRMADYARRLAGLSLHTMTTLLDYLGALIFLRLRRQHQPRFSLIFLNHIAHLQHHFWTLQGGTHPQMELGLRVCNDILGLLLGDLNNGESLIVANALRQENVAGQGFVCYRQRNPAQALDLLGISNARVEQCMTNDAHVLFDDPNAAERAACILQDASLPDGRKLFFLERSAPTRLFYQLSIDHLVENDAVITTPGGSVSFKDIFELVTARTGAHTSEGDVYTLGIDVPGELQNHQLYAAITDHFLGRRRC